MRESAGARIPSRTYSGRNPFLLRRLGSLAHVRWECKYHVVFIPKHGQKVFFDQMRRRIGVILRELCRQRGVELLEGHAMPDHIHMCLSIPPKYSVSHTVGFLKGKSAVRIHRELQSHKRMTGLHYWTTGYWVSTDRWQWRVLLKKHHASAGIWLVFHKAAPAQVRRVAEHAAPVNSPWQT